MKIFTNYYETTAIILFGIGFSMLLLNRNLIKKIIGMNIVDVSIFLFLAAKGYIKGRQAPIIVDGLTNADLYINPIPSGLVLTGIVVSVSMTAFALGLAQKLYDYYGSLDVDYILQRQREGED